MTKLQLPEDVISEASFLATLCAPGCERLASELMPTVTEADFVHPAHKALLRGLRQVLREDLEVTALSLRDVMTRNGDIAKVGGYPGLLELLGADEVGRPHVLAGILRRKRRQRELIRLASRMAHEAAADEGDPETTLESASQELHRIAVDGEVSEGESWLRILEAVAEGASFGKPMRNVIRFGIPSLDHEIVAPPGGVVLLGARPGIGKTALLVQASAESARAGERVLTISIELPKADMQARIAAYFTRQGTSDFRRGTYNQSSAVMSLAGEGDTLGRGVTISPNQGTPWAKIEAEIRRHVDRHGTTVVAMDYFSLIGRPPVGRGSSEAYAYASVSEGITALAKELGIGILLLAQLKKDSDGVKPTLGDFADSDRPARDCWAALLMWRDKNLAIQAHVSKNRGGRVGWTGELNLEGATNRFVEVERTTEVTYQSAACAPKGMAR